MCWVKATPQLRGIREDSSLPCGLEPHSAFGFQLGLFQAGRWTAASISGPCLEKDTSDVSGRSPESHQLNTSLSQNKPARFSHNVRQKNTNRVYELEAVDVSSSRMESAERPTRNKLL